MSCAVLLSERAAYVDSLLYRAEQSTWVAAAVTLYRAAGSDALTEAPVRIPLESNASSPRYGLILGRTGREPATERWCPRWR
jgi:hypothetical protein